MSLSGNHAILLPLLGFDQEVTVGEHSLLKEQHEDYSPDQSYMKVKRE